MPQPNTDHESVTIHGGRRTMGDIPRKKSEDIGEMIVVGVLQQWPYEGAEMIPSNLSQLGQLTQLTLLDWDLSASALLTLVTCFPKLECLCLEGVGEPRIDDKTNFEFDKLKKLRIDRHVSLENLLPLLENLSKLGLCIDEVSLPGIRHWECGTVGECVVRAFGASLKCLRLPYVSEFTANWPNALSTCGKLEEFEFEIEAWPLDEDELKLISSITSRNMKKILIVRHADESKLVRLAKLVISGSLSVWGPLDKALVQLVEQFDDGHVLEFEARVKQGLDRGVDDRDKPHLSKFVSKGGSVRVWDCNSDEVALPKSRRLVASV